MCTTDEDLIASMLLMQVHCISAVYFVAVCPRRPSYMGRGGIIFLINSSIHLCDVCVRARGAGADALSDRLAVDFSFLFVCLLTSSLIKRVI